MKEFIAKHLFYPWSKQWWIDNRNGENTWHKTQISSAKCAAAVFIVLIGVMILCL